MKNLTELLVFLGLFGIVFLSYFIYGMLRKKQISVAVAVKHCNLFWAGVLLLGIFGVFVSPGSETGVNAAPEGAMRLVFVGFLCLSYVAVYAIGQFAAVLLRKIND